MKCHEESRGAALDGIRVGGQSDRGQEVVQAPRRTGTFKFGRGGLELPNVLVPFDDAVRPIPLELLQVVGSVEDDLDEIRQRGPPREVPQIFDVLIDMVTPDEESPE